MPTHESQELFRAKLAELLLAESSPPCPEPELLERMAEESLTADESRRLRAHLEECPSCVTALATLWELHAPAREAHRHSWQSALRSVLERMTVAQQAAWDRHLEGCLRCGTRVEMLRRFYRPFSRGPATAASARFREIPRSQVFLDRIRAGAVGFALCLLPAILAVTIIGGRGRLDTKGAGPAEPARGAAATEAQIVEGVFIAPAKKEQLEQLIRAFEQAVKAQPKLEQDARFASRLSELYHALAALDRPKDPELADWDEQQSRKWRPRRGSRVNEREAAP